MFEDKKNNIDQDLMFRSILSEGQEEVPGRVWDGIEAELDRITRRRVAALWFRRSAIGVAAAAAVTLGVFFGHTPDDNLVDPVSGEGMVAVVQKEEAAQAEPQTEAQVSDAVIPELLAMADVRKDVKKEAVAPIAEEEPAVAETTMQPETETVATPETAAKPETATETKTETKVSKPSVERFPDIWADEDQPRKKTKTAIVVSGITGTNSAQNSNRVNPLKRPGISSAPKKTGIKETSTNTTYGIPVSVGAGVKIDFTERWSVSAGLNYTHLTRKFYGTYTALDPSGNILKDISSEIKETQQYIGIPVNFYYNIVKQDYIHFYTYAGGAVEKCIKDSYQVLDTDIIHNEKAPGVQLSANLGIGVEFMLGKHIGIYIDPSLRYYFKCNQPKSIRTAQPFMVGFEGGLRFVL